MGLKLMNCCKPEQMGTKEHGKMLKEIQTLEGGRIPAKKANHFKSWKMVGSAKEARNWRIEGQERRITGKE